MSDPDPVVDPGIGAAPAPRQPAQPKAAPKWETDTKERIRAMIRKYQKALAALVERDANEGDTRLLVTDFLEHALGYDKYNNLTTEYLVQGEFADGTASTNSLSPSSRSSGPPPSSAPSTCARSSPTRPIRA